GGRGGGGERANRRGREHAAGRVVAGEVHVPDLRQRGEREDAVDQLERRRGEEEQLVGRTAQVRPVPAERDKAVRLAGEGVRAQCGRLPGADGRDRGGEVGIRLDGADDLAHRCARIPAELQRPARQGDRGRVADAVVI